MILVGQISKFEDSDVNGFDKHPFPNIAKKAFEANARKSQVKTLAVTSPKEIAIRQLPLWAEALRCLPNEIAHSALFNAKNRKQPRVYLKQSEIAVIGDGKITYTGEELRQDDETVWLQLIHLAKERPLGNTVDFTPYALCSAVGWSIDGRSYKRLRQCLDRMQATSLSIYSSRLKEGVSLSMIPMFKWCDEAGKALTKYQVKIAPELVTLFGEVHYTRLEWSQRLALPDGIATWLHSYYASHNKPFPVKIGTLKIGAGITTECVAALRQLIEKALARLVAVGFLESWEIVGELVHVKRRV
jgi:hypothetical protein